MEHRQKPNRTLLKINKYFSLTLCPLENSFVRNMDKMSNVHKQIEKINSYWMTKIRTYLLLSKELKVAGDMA